MARPAKKPKAPFVPQFDIQEVPRAKVGNASDKRPDPIDPFKPIMEQVRGLEGRSALILQHQDCREFVRRLKEAYPLFDIVTRTMQSNGKDVMGVWARLKIPTAPIPEIQSQNQLAPPDQG